MRNLLLAILTLFVLTVPAAAHQCYRTHHHHRVWHYCRHPYRLHRRVSTPASRSQSIAVRQEQLAAPVLVQPSPQTGGTVLTYPVTAGVATFHISQHVLILPDGTALEAHSGLGRAQDNPSYAYRRMLGPVPPNTYRLSLRGAIFHGVRALRLTPENLAAMHGRDGFLAHTYLDGPRGETHGCLAVKDYAVLLRAFLSGAVATIEVVE